MNIINQPTNPRLKQTSSVIVGCELRASMRRRRKRLSHIEANEEENELELGKDWPKKEWNCVFWHIDWNNSYIYICLWQMNSQIQFTDYILMAYIAHILGQFSRPFSIPQFSMKL